MTPEDLDVIFSLVVAPGRPAAPRSAVLQHFRTEDGFGLGLKLLHESIDARDAEWVEAALIVCGAFGGAKAHLPALRELAYADWHQQHENVASLLGRIRSSESVGALEHLASWVPDYLAFDENRALAVKALWSLAAIDDPSAREALLRLTSSEDPVVRKEAQAQLARVDKAGPE